MSVREVAIQDIKKDLEKNHKSFLAFREKLNPIMDKLVEEHIKAQEKVSYCLSQWSGFKPLYNKANSQLVARCLFSKGEVSLESFDGYHHEKGTKS